LDAGIAEIGFPAQGKEGLVSSRELGRFLREAT